MKKLVTLLAIALIFSACKKTPSQTCYANGKALSQGSNGGCYYTNSNGNKTYVDRSLCNCK